MKHINITARLTGMAVAVALFAGIVNVNAQAQVKGGQRLLELGGRLVTPKSAPSDYKPMSCPKCQTTRVAVAETDPKGLGARTLMARGTPTKLVARHLCEGCGTDWSVVGHGKAKVSIASHKCTSCGEASLACCNTSKSGTVATNGMDK